MSDKPENLLESGAFGGSHRLNDASLSLRAKVHRALKRGTGCHLSPIEVEAFHCMEGDGDWWNAPLVTARHNQTGER